MKNKIDVNHFPIKELTAHLAQVDAFHKAVKNLSVQDFLKFPRLQDYCDHQRIPIETFHQCFRDYLAKLAPLEGISSDIGIEIEAEKIQGWWSGLLEINKPPYNIWKWATDNSLRGESAEFISSRMPAGHARYALAFLWACFDIFNKRMPSFTWRTSIHVHLNMLDKTVEHLIKFFLVYCVFEDSLFEFANPQRKENIFCIPVCRSRASQAISSFIRNGGNHCSEFIKDSMTKYSALNLLPIVKQGTVEFRHLEGTDNIKRIYRWVCLINAMQNYAGSVTLDELAEIILSLNTTSYYQVFKDKVFTEKYSDLLEDNNLARHMSNGVRFAKECLVVSTRHKIASDSALGVYLKTKEKEKIKVKKSEWDYAPAIGLQVEPINWNQALGQIQNDMHAQMIQGQMLHMELHPEAPYQNQDLLKVPFNELQLDEGEQP